MKKVLIRGMLMALSLILTTSLTAWSANQKTTVSQVTTSISLTNDVDYVVSSATPFGNNGVVNIVNTEHAVLILDAVKPSAALGLLEKHVQINGKRAVYNTNCQVKLYNRGCIILPYEGSFKPLTVYSEPNFAGESCSDFGLENTGGFMNTLTDEKLNNRIRSFKLKRGYMVTFANGKGGRGYSRCFIAADKDLEIANMPAVLDRSISSYRIFKWYDTGKQALANDTRANSVEALNVTSCYSFGLGENRGIDCECVPHHIKEDWPSAADCGRVSYSPHLKTNNEPGNSADDTPQSVAVILDNWENLMRTGMRLCSPSSHDGSLNHLREFMDSIDARGWRCDIIDLHCYWAESSFNEWSFKTQWVDRYHRPIWISEWVWGASWNQNGAFASGVTESQNAEAIKRICGNLNNWDYIERYYYWNSERDPSRIMRDNFSLTAAGQYYATINSGVGYNGKYDYAPKVVKQRTPSGFTLEFDNKTKVATLKWHDYNGEMNGGIYVERRVNSSAKWETFAEIPMEESAADYTYEDKNSGIGYQYRVLVVDGNGDERRTNQITAAAKEVQAGDAIEINGVTKYLGGNVFKNGNFMMGLTGWTNGAGEPLAAPYFQDVAKGGFAGYPYLQCYGDGDENSEKSIRQVVDIKPNTDYYFAGAVCNTTNLSSFVYGSSDGIQKDKSFLYIHNTTGSWVMQSKTFNSEAYSKAILSFRALGAKAQFGNLYMGPLYDTLDEAVADGLSSVRQTAQLFQSYNTKYTFINDDLTQKMNAVTTNDANALAALQTLLEQAFKAYSYLNEYARNKSLWSDYVALNLPGSDELQQMLSQFDGTTTIDAIVASYPQLTAAVEAYYPQTSLTDAIVSPSFSTSTGWTTKCGTYTAGDQRLNKQNDVTFWNAWWSGIDASEGTAKSMAIKQTVENLGHGLYSLECKASTEHFCLSDQHAYLTDGTTTVSTPVLTADYYDLPTVSVEDRWQTLLTSPLYVPDDAALTVGFVGTKEGAINGAWHKVGDTKAVADNREGWWCATDFVLKFHPLYRTTVEPNQWNVTCLPYAVKASDGVKFYMIGAVTADLKNLCLYEVTEVPAGLPFIFKSEKADVSLYEYGAKAKEPVLGQGNLWGYFRTTARVPKQHYYLDNGVWKKVDPENRPRMSNYTAVILPFDDSLASYIPKKDNWEGETMPIEGLTEAEYALAISNVTLSSTQLEDGLYTIDGRKINSIQVNKGIYLKVENGHVYKIIKK